MEWTNFLLGGIAGLLWFGNIWKMKIYDKLEEIEKYTKLQKHLLDLKIDKDLKDSLNE